MVLAQMRWFLAWVWHRFGERSKYLSGGVLGELYVAESFLPARVLPAVLGHTRHCAVPGGGRGGRYRILADIGYWQILDISSYWILADI